MRVECEACRGLVEASFRIEGDAVGVTCPACRHVMRVPGDVPPDVMGDASGDPAGPAPRCPKCGAACRGEAIACPACGLAVTVNARPARRAGPNLRHGSLRLDVCRANDAAEARDAAGPGAVPEAVRAAWTRTVEAWSDPARHDELLQLVATHRAYAWAAGRYRARGDDAIARRQLDRLRRAAEAALLAGATPRPDVAARTSSRTRRRLLALVITTIAAGALYAMGIADPPPPSSARPSPARLLPAGHPARPPTGK